VRQQRWIRLMVGVVALLLAAGTAFGPGVASAQDASGTPGMDAGTPSAGDTDVTQMDGAAHPAHIHTGTCDAVGDVVFPLNDLIASDESGMATGEEDMADTEGDMDIGTPGAEDGMMATPEIGEVSQEAGNDVEGMDGDGVVVAQSTTVLEATIEDLLAAPHVINVHESAENIQNYIACGELADMATLGAHDGTPVSGAEDMATPMDAIGTGRSLQIHLSEMNDSGYEGRATIVEMGDGTVEVTVQLMQATDMDDGGDMNGATDEVDMGTPEATPAG
jgi:hypothetical protein